MALLSRLLKDLWAGLGLSRPLPLWASGGILFLAGWLVSEALLRLRSALYPAKTVTGPPPDVRFHPALGCLGTLVGLAGSPLLLFVFVRATGHSSQNPARLSQGVLFLAALLGILLGGCLYGWRRHIKYREFLLGALIGVGVIALILGYSVAVLSAVVSNP